MKVSQGFVLSGIGRSRYSDHWVRITTTRRDGVMSHLIRALSGQHGPDGSVQRLAGYVRGDAVGYGCSHFARSIIARRSPKMKNWTEVFGPAVILTMTMAFGVYTLSNLAG